MVAAALQAIHERAWFTGTDARALPQVQAILQGSEALRRECILSASERVDSYHNVQLLSAIARKRVELSAEHIERLLALRLVKLDQPESWWSSECLRVVSRQIE